MFGKPTTVATTTSQESAMISQTAWVTQLPTVMTIQTMKQNHLLQQRHHQSQSCSTHCSTGCCTFSSIQSVTSVAPLM